MKRSMAIAAVIILAIIAFVWPWIMEDPYRPSNSEVAKTFAEVIAVVIGGCWVNETRFLSFWHMCAVGFVVRLQGKI